MSDPTDGVSEWAARTTAYDRVRSVASTVPQPRSVQHIADEACAGEVTAREYLNRLADLGILLKSEREGTPLYRPDPLYTRMTGIRDLLGTHTRDDLLQLKAEMQSQLEDEDGSKRESDLVEYRMSLVSDAIEYSDNRAASDCARENSSGERGTNGGK